MNDARMMAGGFAGSGAIILLVAGAIKGDMGLIAIGATILSSMMSFFVGEQNGKKHTG